jgi:hypothetical protein
MSQRSVFLRRATVLGCAVVVGITLVAVLSRSDSVAEPSGWDIITSPNGNAAANDVLLGSACANAQECWGVGASLVNSGGATPLFEEWDGTSWEVAPSPTAPQGSDYALLAVTCVTGSDCWAVGTVLGGAENNPVGTLIENWNGSGWTVVPSPTPSGAVGAILESVSCTSASGCWAVGFTADANGKALTALTENWDGSAWSIVASAYTAQTCQQFNGVSCTSPSNCWAVGSDGAVQQNPNFLPIYPAAAGNQGLIEHWDGSAWSVVPSVTSPAPDGGYLASVTCVSSSDCWAAGSTTDDTGTADDTLTENWNGSTWSAIPSANPSQPEDTLSGVTCLDASRCWAVGASGTKGGGGGSMFQPKAFIEAWNGQTWSIQPSPNVTAASLLGSVVCIRGVSCWSVGASVTGSQAMNAVFQTLIEQMTLPPSSNQGLLMAAQDGGIFAFGDAGFYGSMGGQHLNAPVVGMAPTPDGGGYWEVSSDGGIFALGDAGFYGSMGSVPLSRPISGLAATPNGHGYWEVASDGGIFAFGNAGYFGSVPGQGISSPVPLVGVSPAPDGQGYWLAGSDGSLYAYGDATYLGSLGGLTLAAPIVGLAAP